MSNPNRPPRRSMTEVLFDLEQCDPVVRAAAEEYHRSVWQALFRHRIRERRKAEGKKPIRYTGVIEVGGKRPPRTVPERPSATEPPLPPRGSGV